MEYTAFLEGPPLDGGVGQSSTYTSTVYNHALPALSAMLSSLAATLPSKTPCPYNLATAAGLLKALEELKVKEFMQQQQGDNGKYKIT